MNKTILQGKWRQARGNLKTEWGRLTDNERRQLDGKIDHMVDLVQERYGYTQDRAAKTLAHYLGSYGKRSQSRTDDRVQRWFPAMGVVGLFSLAAAGWFFFTRFMTSTPSELNPEVSAELEALTSPETDFG